MLEHEPFCPDEYLSAPVRELGRRIPVRGLVVGALGIRPAREGDRFWNRGEKQDVSDNWIVENESGAVMACKSIADALTIADDVSRFAGWPDHPVEIAGATFAEFPRLLGDPMCRWLGHIMRGGKVAPFRQWLAEREAAAPGALDTGASLR